MSGPIEVERCGAYFRRPERPGTIGHLPQGEASFFVATHAPYGALPLAYMIFLPYHWPDSQRLREAAIYIAHIELGLWQRTPLDQIVYQADMGRQEYITVLEIADRLIAPRPWVEDMVRRFGSRRSALKQAARALSIPVESIDTVLRAQRSSVADAVHRHVKEVTGYPWFLPTHLRDIYPADRW
jgi:hypothetical protein